MSDVVAHHVPHPLRLTQSAMPNSNMTNFDFIIGALYIKTFFIVEGLDSILKKIRVHLNGELRIKAKRQDLKILNVGYAP